MIILVALALLIAGARLHTYDEPLERDIASFAVVGHELVLGRALYSEIWDHKPPAIHATFAAAEWLVGYGRHAVYLLGLAASLVTLVGVYATVLAVEGRGPALWAAAFWAVVSGDLWLQANQPNTEVFINACLIWAFALLVRARGGGRELGRFLAIGALLALASTYKYVVITHALLLSAAHLAWPPDGPAGRRRAAAGVAMIIAVGVVTWAGTAGYFGATGRAQAFNEAVFVYNRAYAGSLLANLREAVRLRRLAPWVLEVAIPLVVLTLVGVVVGLVRGLRRPWRLWIAFAVGTELAVALPGRFYPHYFQLWLPLVAVAAGWAIGELGRLARPRAWVAHLVGAGTLVLLLAFELPQYQLTAQDWSRAKYGPDFVASQKLGRDLATLLRPDETLFEWGAEPDLFFESGRRPASGVFYIYPLGAPAFTAGMNARIVADLDRQPPEVLVLARWTMPPGWSAGRPEIWSLGPALEWASTRYRPLPGDLGGSDFLVFIRRGGRVEQRVDRGAAR